MFKFQNKYLFYTFRREESTEATKSAELRNSAGRCDMGVQFRETVALRFCKLFGF